MGTNLVTSPLLFLTAKAGLIGGHDSNWQCEYGVPAADAGAGAEANPKVL